MTPSMARMSESSGGGSTADDDRRPWGRFGVFLPGFFLAIDRPQLRVVVEMNRAQLHLSGNGGGALSPETGLKPSESERRAKLDVSAVEADPAGDVGPSRISLRHHAPGADERDPLRARRPDHDRLDDGDADGTLGHPLEQEARRGTTGRVALFHEEIHRRQGRY